MYRQPWQPDQPTSLRPRTMRAQTRAVLILHLAGTLAALAEHQA